MFHPRVHRLESRILLIFENRSVVSALDMRVLVETYIRGLGVHGEQFHVRDFLSILLPLRVVEAVYAPIELLCGQWWFEHVAVISFRFGLNFFEKWYDFTIKLKRFFLFGLSFTLVCCFLDLDFARDTRPILLVC